MSGGRQNGGQVNPHSLGGQSAQDASDIFSRLYTPGQQPGSVQGMPSGGMSAGALGAGANPMLMGLGMMQGAQRPPLQPAPMAPRPQMQPQPLPQMPGPQMPQAPWMNPQLMQQLMGRQGLMGYR